MLDEHRNDVITDRRVHPRIDVETGEIKRGRRRGRPRVCDGPTEKASTDVPVDAFDVLCRQADAAGISLREHLRRILVKQAGPAILAAKNRQPHGTRAS